MAANPLSVFWQDLLDEAVIHVAAGPGRIAALPAEGRPLIATPDGQTRTWATGHGGGNLAAGLDAAATRLATVGQDGRVRIHGADGLTVAEATAGDGWVEHLAWHAHGCLATASGPVATLWGEQLAASEALPPRPSTIAGLAWSPDGKTLAISHHGGVSLLDPSAALRVLPWRTSLLHLTWSQDGVWLAAATQECSVHLWRASDATHCDMAGFPGKVHALAWDRRRRLACAGGAEVAVWDCAGDGPADRRPTMFTWHRAVVAALAWQPGADWCASGDGDGWLALWRLGSDAPATCVQLPAAITCLAWTPDGARLIAGCADGTVAASGR